MKRNQQQQNAWGEWLIWIECFIFHKTKLTYTLNSENIHAVDLFEIYFFLSLFWNSIAFQIDGAEQRFKLMEIYNTYSMYVNLFNLCV